MVYKRSKPEEIAERNAKAYLGSEAQQKEANKALKKWLKKPVKLDWLK